jgi:hypothetical protein
LITIELTNIGTFFAKKTKENRNLRKERDRGKERERNIQTVRGEKNRTTGGVHAERTGEERVRKKISVGKKRIAGGKGKEVEMEGKKKEGINRGKEELERERLKRNMGKKQGHIY